MKEEKKCETSDCLVVHEGSVYEPRNPCMNDVAVLSASKTGNTNERSSPKARVMNESVDSCYVTFTTT